jgi:hypothetical protein
MVTQAGKPPGAAVVALPIHAADSSTCFLQNKQTLFASLCADAANHSGPGLYAQIPTV